MSQESDVNNCFDSAFLQVVGQHPDPNKSMSDDYSLPSAQVGRILYLTSTCLTAKGYIFTPTQALVEQCATSTVLGALQTVNANTKVKAQQPLVAALGASGKKPRRTKKSKKKSSKTKSGSGRGKARSS